VEQQPPCHRNPRARLSFASGPVTVPLRMSLGLGRRRLIHETYVVSAVVWQRLAVLRWGLKAGLGRLLTPLCNQLARHNPESRLLNFGVSSLQSLVPHPVHFWKKASRADPWKLKGAPSFATDVVKPTYISISAYILPLREAEDRSRVR
jgi:hypothetical protein